MENWITKRNGVTLDRSIDGIAKENGAGRSREESTKSARDDDEVEEFANFHEG